MPANSSEYTSLDPYKSINISQTWPQFKMSLRHEYVKAHDLLLVMTLVSKLTAKHKPLVLVVGGGNSSAG